MNPSSPSRTRRPAWPIAVLAVAVAAICAFAVWRGWTDTAPPAAQGAVAVSAPDAPAALQLPDDPRVLIFGDSWTYGSAASDPTLGYAYVIAERLGWDATVDGVRGSGYLKGGYLEPGIPGGTFGERIAALDPALAPDLVIIEGSVNDRKLGAEGYREAVDAAWDALAAIYPDATIVVLGPAPQVLPVEAGTQRIDTDLRELAAVRGWWYLSPIAEEWITTTNYAEIIDTSELGNDHPSTAGHEYLATRLAEDLAKISATADAAAPAQVDPLVP